MKKIVEIAAASSGDAGPALADAPVGNTLEQFARKGIQQWMKRLLEEEVDDLLGRRKSERRSDEGDPKGLSGYRNGFGKLCKLALTSGTITIKRPRVRDLDVKFESRLLPLFKKSTDQVGALLPELYLHGLSLGDFDLALRATAPRCHPAPLCD